MPMKEQVADISKVLQDITAEMRLMRETIDQQYAEIAKLNRNIEALNRQIRKKDETIDDTPNYCTNCGGTLADAERVLDYVTLHFNSSTIKFVWHTCCESCSICQN